MSRCLCCGKELRTETAHGWHTACVKAFFGTTKFPDIDVSKEVLNQIAIDNTSKGFTVPGVQKKLSLHLSREDTPRLTLVNYPTGYILKPQTDEYAALPEMEYLVMQMAEVSGIKTVPHALLRLPSQENAFAYITKRIDRADGQMLAMEDFCQLDGRLTEDKYRGSYERCGKIIKTHSMNDGLDLAQLFFRVVFSFAVGNSDMHLKNFSLIETEEGSGKYILSSAYDMLSTNVVIPSDKDELALTINGKKQNICRKDFLVFADTIGIPERSAEKMIEKIVKLKDKYISMCRDSYMPEQMRESLENLIEQRIAVLTK
ncbi:MAG: HipA domain-containing protein [Christensenellaceae bacterium]|nr:HipA domain-containing protein [Christensenellaceae bacterium]